MKKLIVVNVAIVIALLMNSCASSNDVVSNRLISKRKYTKGLFVKKNLKLKSDGVEESENYAMNTEESNSESENINLSVRELKNINSEIEGDKMLNSANVASTHMIEMLIVEEEVHPNAIRPKNNELSGSLSTRNGVKKEFQKALKDQVKAKKAIDTGDPVMLILLIILALFLPPVAIAIYRGIDNIFWLDLVLFLIGLIGFWFLPISGLAALAAIIIAFLVIFDVI